MKSAATAVLGIALAGCGSSSPAERVLDARRAPYVEDEPGGRALAAIDARLIAEAGQARLVLALSAEGPEVEPVPGFAGVRGSNRITARELDRIARERTLAVETKNERGEGRPGGYRVARAGPVRERRVRPDGSLELDGVTREDLALELRADSGALPPGRWTTTFALAGRPRLAVGFWFDGRDGAIERIDPHPAPVPEEISP